MRHLPFLVAATAAAIALPAVIPISAAAVHAPAVTGDEATINAQAMDLDARIRSAEKSGAMSHADADRHSRSLARMVRSAKDDLRRPPHVISAAKNAKYSRNLASVDAALKKVRH